MLSGHKMDRYKTKIEAVGLSLNDDPYNYGRRKLQIALGYDLLAEQVWTHPTHLCLDLLHFKTWDVHSGPVSVMEAARSL